VVSIADEERGAVRDVVGPLAAVVASLTRRALRPMTILLPSESVLSILEPSNGSLMVPGAAASRRELSAMRPDVPPM
jgi:hypothetical protein